MIEISGRGQLRFAWHIGNRHTPRQVETHRLLIASLGLTILNAAQAVLDNSPVDSRSATFGTDHAAIAHETQEIRVFCT